MKKTYLVASLAMMASSVAFAGGTYSALDADKSGAISQDEAAAMPGLTEQWTTLDVDANGELSIEEFARFETSAPEMSAPEKK